MSKAVLLHHLRRIGLWSLVILVLAFYFVQHSRMAPNHTDGGLILTYVDDIANGLMPHRDFIDAYGLLNWPGVVLFYKLAGHKIWGIRLWMLTLKIIIVIVSFKFVQRLAGTFYAVLAGLWMTLLYGMAWQSLQTAYGFNNVIPFVIGAWYFLLSGPLSTNKNMIVAGVFTGIAVWIKVNAGLFLLASGLFHCFYWLPPAKDDRVLPVPSALAIGFRIAQYGGLVTYVLIFYGYVRQYFDVWYFAYLVGPLLLVVIYTLFRLARVAPQDAPVRHRIKTWSVYLAVTLAFVLGLLVIATGGVTGAAKYIADQADILIYLDYMLPFSHLGVPDEFIGFNENYWLQLPWLFTLVFLAWLVIQRRGRGEAAFGERLEVEHSRGVGIFVMATLYQYCMYSRADETHVFQAMVVIPPALFVLLGQLEHFVAARPEAKLRPYRYAAATAAVLWGSTIAVTPGFEVFDLSTGERSHPKLEYLRFREIVNPYVRDFSPDLTDNEWDRVVDEAGQYIDSIVPDGEPILVLDANRLIHVISNTRPVGGRYHFYFYLLSTKLFHRDGFDQAVPPEILQGILEDPPLVAVGAVERIPPIAKNFPEIRQLIAERYEVTRKFRHIVIYELRQEYREQASAAPPRGRTRLGSRRPRRVYRQQASAAELPDGRLAFDL